MQASLAATPAMLKTDIYVQVFINCIRAKNIGSGATSDTLPPEPLLHPRMLVGHFAAAELAVKTAVAEVKGSKLFHTTHVLMHPIERMEGEVLFLKGALGFRYVSMKTRLGEA
jgi:hypothetical protein